MEQAKPNNCQSLGKTSRLFWLSGFICFIIYACIAISLKSVNIPYYNLLKLYRHFYFLEIFIVMAISIFYLIKTNERPNIQDNLMLSLFYLGGYVLGEIFLMVGTFLTIIGAVWLMFYVSTYYSDILNNFVIESILRFFYVFVTVFITTNFVFGFKNIITAITTKEINFKKTVKPFLFLLLIPIALFLYNFLNITLNQIITEPEFYVGSTDYRKIPQVKLSNGDTIWYMPLYVSRDIRFVSQEARNIEFYDFSSDKTYIVPKPLDMNIQPIILSDQNILFIGGEIYEKGKKIFKKQSYLFDCNKKTFNRVGDLKASLRTSKALILPNSKALILHNSKVLLLDNEDKHSQLFDVNNGKFELTGANCIQIWNEKGFVLKNNTVLIYGSYKDGTNSYKIRTQLYDVHTNKFIPIKNQAISNETFKPIILNNGQVLIIGTKKIKIKELYSNWIEKEVQTVEIYDPNSNQFLPLKNTLNIQRKNPKLTLLNNGQVLITGGEELIRMSKKKLIRTFIKESEIYNPETQTFKQVGSRKNRLRNSFSGGAEYILPNGNVLFIGGVEGAAQCSKYSKIIEMFDIKTNKFKVVGKMRKERGNPLIIPSGNKIIIYDGVDSGNRHDKFFFERQSAEVLDLNRFK